MDGAERDPLDVATEELHDLAALRKLVDDGHRYINGSPAWIEHWDAVEALTRRIREWASRPE